MTPHELSPLGRIAHRPAAFGVLAGWSVGVLGSLALLVTGRVDAAATVAHRAALLAPLPLAIVAVQAGARRAREARS